MRLLKLTIISFFLVGCDCKSQGFQQEEWEKKVLVERKDLISNKVVYTKDLRTNLCFASLYLGSRSGTMTQVPCTPEVERILDK